MTAFLRRSVILWLGVPCLLNAQDNVKLSDGLTVPVIKPWQALPARTRNLVELVLPASKPEAPNLARIAITTETRDDHAGAVLRLKEIAAERAGEIRYDAVCGWPAIERRVVIDLPQVMQGEKVRKHLTGASVKATVATVAAAVGNMVVRYEGTVDPSAPANVADQIIALAGRLQCSAKPLPGQTNRERQSLTTVPAKRGAALAPPPSPLERSGEILPAAGGFSLQSPARVVTGAELQIGVSNNGLQVLIGTNGGNSFSVDSGATFTAAPLIPWGFPTDGDPSIGVGASGNFYFSSIGFPANGCTDSVARSTNGGQNFVFAGNAVLCTLNGNGACFPDQEQMAVDRNNRAGANDQLYMVWRNFPAQSNTACTNITRGNPTPTISCSQDSGNNWGSQTAVGTGDVGRPIVGGDGFVYVVYVSGSNLMINKFSSCANNLVQQNNFPVTIASMNGVTCPVPGQDRCSPSGMASAQAAVDDTNPQHVLVAYADSTASDNENVVVAESTDGGRTWPRTFNMSSAAKARRFMPWLCVTQGVAYSTWYDRTQATQAAPDLTAYFLNTASGSPMTPATEGNISRISDPQCASGWPGGADSFSNSTGCPAGTPVLQGVCLNSLGAGSQNPCTPAGVCPLGETCQPTGGVAKYGDYNGNACMRGGAYVAWASATPPPGVLMAPAGINVYTNRFNYLACGQQSQACCFAGSQCRNDTLACDATVNTCVACGTHTRAIHLDLHPVDRPLLVVGRQATLSGMLQDTDTPGCTIPTTSVTFSATAGQLAPTTAQTAGAGEFSTTYTAPLSVGGQDLRTLAPPATIHVLVHPDVTSMDARIVPVAGLTPATIHGAGFVSGSTTVSISSQNVPGAITVTPQSVTGDTIHFQMPRSPLPGDGSGPACASVVVNGVASECLGYNYVLPGKPVIEFTWTGCGSGAIVAYVYDGNGAQIVVPVRFTAAYNAFKDAAGNYTNSLTVPAGQLVYIIIRGPITATNTIPPSLSVTQNFPDPPLRLCGDVWLTKGRLDPRLEAFDVEKLLPRPLPPCPLNECPDPLRNKVVGWTVPQDKGGPQPYVTITGGNLETLISKFSVRTLASTELGQYVGDSPDLAIRGKVIQASAEFAGAAVSIAMTGHPAGAVDELSELGRISFPLPKGSAKPDEYHVLHLSDAGKTRMWVEEAPPQFDADKSSILMYVRETGIYALARVSGR